MFYYRVEYSFSSGIPGKERYREYDIWLAKDCQEAVDLCRGEYGHLPYLRIERVWKEIRNSWLAVNAWS